MGSVDIDNRLLDLSLKTLKKIPEPVNAQLYHTLILDDNELQKIDNIQFYSNVQKLSLSKNQLLRMHEVGQLSLLQELNLSYNGILTIEGLNELKNLKHLNLAGNKLIAIEHLNANINLKLLNLSENSISIVSDVSFLKSLEKLYLHDNRLTHLRNCDKFFPHSLHTLTLAKNFISDLNEICTLSSLSNLENLTINENPCVQMKIFSNGFDHRPFVLNWCLTLKTIDNFAVTPIESLKAEWLYSQGRGRQFRLGEQESLSRYLTSVCPLHGKALEYENERKLRLILRKAQFHQKQLLEESPEISKQYENHTASKSNFSNDSPRARYFNTRQASNFMSNSFHGNPSLHSSITGSNETLNSRRPFEMASSLVDDLQRGSTKCRSMDSLDKASIEEARHMPCQDIPSKTINELFSIDLYLKMDLEDDYQAEIDRLFDNLFSTAEYEPQARVPRKVPKYVTHPKSEQRTYYTPSEAPIIVKKKPTTYEDAILTTADDDIAAIGPKRYFPKKTKATITTPKRQRGGLLVRLRQEKAKFFLAIAITKGRAEKQKLFKKAQEISNQLKELNKRPHNGKLHLGQ